MNRIKYLAVVSAATCCSLATAQVQVTAPMAELTTCADSVMKVRVASLKRIGPGELVVRMEGENLTNSVAFLRGRFQLIDDRGDEWRFAGSLNDGGRVRQYAPGVKTAVDLKFTRDIGGKDAVDGTFTVNAAVVKYPATASSMGWCGLTVKKLPIE